jgi:hypothetical protein
LGLKDADFPCIYAKAVSRTGTHDLSHKAIALLLRQGSSDLFGILFEGESLNIYKFWVDVLCAHLQEMLNRNVFQLGSFFVRKS